MTKLEALLMIEKAELTGNLNDLVLALDACKEFIELGTFQPDWTDYRQGKASALKEALEQPTQGLIESIIGKQRTPFTPLDEVINEFMKDPAMKQAMDKARATTQEEKDWYASGFDDGFLYAQPDQAEHIAELQLNNQKLHEALEKIAYMGTDNAMGTNKEYFLQRQLNNYIGIATEALGVTK